MGEGKERERGRMTSSSDSCNEKTLILSTCTIRWSSFLFSS